MSERGRRGVIQFPVNLRFPFILLALTLSVPLLSYSQGKALVRIDEDVQAFAIGPDNRIVYAVQHMRKFKKARVERDDLWISSPEGKQKKIGDGEKIFADVAELSGAVVCLVTGRASHCGDDANGGNGGAERNERSAAR